MRSHRLVVLYEDIARRMDRDDFSNLVKGMTNWERNQWARAGYPGLRPRQPEPAPKRSTPT